MPLGEDSLWAHSQLNSFTCRTMSVVADDNYWYNCRLICTPASTTQLLYPVRHSLHTISFSSTHTCLLPLFLSALSSSSSSSSSLHWAFARSLLPLVPTSYLFRVLIFPPCCLFLSKHWRLMIICEYILTVMCKTLKHFRYSYRSCNVNREKPYPF